MVNREMIVWMLGIISREQEYRTAYASVISSSQSGLHFSVLLNMRICVSLMFEFLEQRKDFMFFLHFAFNVKMHRDATVSVQVSSIQPLQKYFGLSKIHY